VDSNFNVSALPSFGNIDHSQSPLPSLPSFLPFSCRYTLELMSGRQLGAKWASEEAGKDAECLARRNGFKKTSEVREGGMKGRAGRRDTV